MSKNSKKRETPVEPESVAHAAYYKVLEGSKPIPMQDGRHAVPGDTFKASSVLCYPVQLNAILAAEPARVRAVKAIKK